MSSKTRSPDAVFRFRDEKTMDSFTQNKLQSLKRFNIAHTYWQLRAKLESYPLFLHPKQRP